jgi:hypothetical protein
MGGAVKHVMAGVLIVGLWTGVAWGTDSNPCPDGPCPEDDECASEAEGGMCAEAGAEERLLKGSLFSAFVSGPVSLGLGITSLVFGGITYDRFNERGGIYTALTTLLFVAGSIWTVYGVAVLVVGFVSIGKLAELRRKKSHARVTPYLSPIPGGGMVGVGGYF